MLRYNTDPKTGGYAYMPVNSITSRFSSGADIPRITKRIIDSGIEPTSIDVFTGALGADTIDTTGFVHGIWVKFIRSIEDIFTDESNLFNRANETMRSGGSIVSVFIGKSLEDRKKVSEVLVAEGGLDTVYWGRWVTEYLGIADNHQNENREMSSNL